MAGVQTCVDHALGLLKGLRVPIGNNIDTLLWWKDNLQLQLKFLRTFLRYVAKWSVEDKIEYLEFLPVNIEYALRDAEPDLAVHCGEANENLMLEQQTLLSAFNEFDQRISPFESQVAETYNYLSMVSHPPMSDRFVFDEFVGSVQENLEDLAVTLHRNYRKQGQSPPSGALEQCLAVKKKLENLRCLFRSFAEWCNEEEKLRGPLAHLGAVVFSIAHLSFRCLPYTRLNIFFIPQDLFLTLSDLAQKITHEAYVGILKASMPSQSISSMRVDDVASSSFLSFLLSMENRVDNLSEGLTFPLMVLMDPPENYTEDMELTLTLGLADLAREAGSLDSFCINEMLQKKVKVKLSKTMQQIKLIKAEIFLLELRNHKTNLMVSAANSISALRQGVRYLTEFLKAQDKYMDHSGKVILTQLDGIIREAVSFYGKFHARIITEDIILNSSLAIFKLFMAEAMLMMLINSKSSLTFLIKYRIQTLHEGLMLMRALLTAPTKDSMMDGKFSLSTIEAMATEATFFICSFGECKMKEDHSMTMKVLLSHFSGKIELIKAEVDVIYLQVPRSSLSVFPKTNGHGYSEFLFHKLREILMYRPDSISLIKDQLQVFLREVELLKPFLSDVANQVTVHQELKDFAIHIIGLIYEAEYVVDLFVARDGPVWYHMLLLLSVFKEIRFIKAQVECYDKKMVGHQAHGAASTSKHLILEASNATITEAIVGLDDQAQILLNQLTRGSLHLDIVSIVGMPGLGKTTLAKKVYNDLSTKYHFHVTAWCCVSHVYRKGELLLDILGDVIELTDQVTEMDDDELSQTLYQSLKGKRYLIVMDDMWTIGPWNDLKSLFPDDKVGSRVLFTSRIHQVASLGNPNREPHSLRLLSQEESWELFQDRLFHRGSCPEELLELGRKIANNCKGLPLAVVVIASVLKRTNQDKNWWKTVAESLRSHIVDDPQKQCTNILELSYNHLPDYLKPCFLYLGAFLEDQEIPVSKLKWLWIAEGFIPQNNKKSVEETAEDYLRDLIGRSLVIEIKRKSNGGTKSCRVHNLLRNLCIRKAREENFFQLISRYDSDDSLCYCPSDYITCEQYRLCIHSEKEHFIRSKHFGPCIHSLLFFSANKMQARCSYNISFIFHKFKLLRVLDLESINVGKSFPVGIELLVQLRYLAVRGDMNSVPSSIVNLWSLETFLVKGMKGEILLPNTIWGMARLRHIHVNNRAAFPLPGHDLLSSSLLVNLSTLSSPVLSSGKETEKILKRLFRLQRLRCIFLESWDRSRNCNMFPTLDLLTQLESLKILYYGRISYPCKFSFPLNLKKLTLSKFRLPWTSISEISRLPNLEVLKLLFRAFEGKRWDMTEGEFPNLKILKLDNLNLVKWNASNDNFPKLQRLVLRSCKQLEDVPACFGDISTLRMIEVHWCCRSTANYIRMIQDQQVDMGNEEFKVLINPPEWDFKASS